ncbi:MAG: pseudouridine-5'-phosphate glycosidase [Phycisphaerales bacterium]|nr:pseudouridine-5'-phosphate glycosidase [Phycisphaerales bacterium]
MHRVQLHPEVAQSLRDQAPIVALESAVATSGLPRDPIKLPPHLKIAGWNDAQPANLQLALAMERTVREAGAGPATIAVIDGTLKIGLDQVDLSRLATDPTADKASATDLAHAIATGATSGTTVSATLTACALTHSAPSTQHSALPGFRVLATGGIGGVHRNWQQLPDISHDLRALSHTPVCVVCSGAKSILDLPATLEALETLGVPVIGYRTHSFPQFQCRSSNDLPLRACVDDVQSAARLCIEHWSTLGLRSAIILANPVPDEFAIDRAEFEQAVASAERLASSRTSGGTSGGISGGTPGGGSARTPFLLAEIARLTSNRSLHANLALLINNARLAAEVAIALVQTIQSDHPAR